MLITKLKTIFIKNQPFTTEEAKNLLKLSSQQTSKRLYNLTKQGHLYKLKRGLYLPAPHKGLTPAETLSDPWLIVPSMFPKSYIGGWSAATQWGLTEQLFNRTCIMTCNILHHKTVTIGRFEYVLFSQKYEISGDLEIVIRENTSVAISDVHRTIIDMLSNPECGAGIQHVIDCFKTYLSEYYDETILIKKVKKVNQGTFFKRLGYIIERLKGADHPLCIIAKSRITKGASKIDNKMNCTKLITRWNLYINESIVI